MYIAMNRFKVKRGAEEEFEQIWRNRQRNLSEMDGFIEFKLLHGLSCLMVGMSSVSDPLAGRCG